jgi:hypothetical protein
VLPANDVIYETDGGLEPQAAKQWFTCYLQSAQNLKSNPVKRKYSASTPLVNWFFKEPQRGEMGFLAGCNEAEAVALRSVKCPHNIENACGPFLAVHQRTACPKPESTYAFIEVRALFPGCPLCTRMGREDGRRRNQRSTRFAPREYELGAQRLAHQENTKRLNFASFRTATMNPVPLIATLISFWRACFRT